MQGARGIYSLSAGGVIQREAGDACSGRPTDAVSGNEEVSDRLTRYKGTRSVWVGVKGDGFDCDDVEEEE